MGTYWVLRDMGTEYGGSNHSGAKLCQNTALECNFLGVQSMLRGIVNPVCHSEDIENITYYIK